MRAYGNKLVQVFQSGTDTLVWEGTTDSSGHYEIDSLPTGIYDVRIDGQRVQTFHHVKADHTHEPDQTYTFAVGAPVSSDWNERDDTPIFAPGAAGSIIRASLVIEACSAAADVVIHLLAGPQNAASMLTFASNSVWQHQVNPGEIIYRYTHVDTNPGVTLTASQVVTMGIDNVTTGIAGVTFCVVFRPD